MWRGSEGKWYVLRSSGNASRVVLWGLTAVGDVAVPGDYDGDGKCDIAVWRVSEGRWYILQSRDGAMRAVQQRARASSSAVESAPPETPITTRSRASTLSRRNAARNWLKALRCTPLRDRRSQR